MTAWLIQSLSGSALLLAAVMFVRPLAFRRLGPGMAYALWLLPLVRLALPVTPVWTVPESFVSAVFGPGLDGPATMVGASDAIVAHAMRADQVAKAFLGVWTLGAAAHLGWRLAAYVWFVQRARAASTGPGIVREGVDIQTSAFVSGPVAAGIWKRRIFLPLDFDVRFDAEQRRLILAHELAHHRRRDIAWNFAALIVVSVHWFNPLAHHAYRLYRLDQELACDADVVAGSPALRHPYGALLAQAVWRGDTSPLCSLSKAALLKRRLAALAGTVTPSSGLARVALAPLAIAGLLLTAPISISCIESAKPLLARPTKSAVQAPVQRRDARPSGDPTVTDHDAGPRPSTARLAVLLTPATVATPGDIETAADIPSASPQDDLAERRQAGLLRSQYRLADPARTARDRGRPVFLFPPTGT